jgi:hypothetical protein
MTFSQNTDFIIKLIAMVIEKQAPPMDTVKKLGST